MHFVGDLVHRNVKLHVQLRLLAPFLPYVTEEVWSWWQDGSVHLQAWPVAADVATGTGEEPADPAMLDAVAAALAGLRGAKSQAKVSMRTPVLRAVVRGPEALVAAARAAEGDLRKAGKVTGDLVFEAADQAEVTVEAELAPVEG